MYRNLSNYYLSQARRKRNAEVISIHLGLYPDGVPLEEVLPGQDSLMQEFEMQQMLHDLACFRTTDENCPHEGLRLWHQGDFQPRKNTDEAHPGTS